MFDLKKLMVFLCCLLVVGISGCGKKDWITDLKEQSISSFGIKPIGLVFDAWQSCDATKWDVLNESEGFAEVRYECEMSGVSELVDALVKKQTAINEANKIKLRKLKKDIHFNKHLIKFGACESQLLADKFENGWVEVSAESDYIFSELKAFVSESNKLAQEILMKVERGDEITLEYAKNTSNRRSELSNKIYLQYSAPDFFDTHADEPIEPRNKMNQPYTDTSYKGIQQRLMECVNEFPRPDGQRMILADEGSGYIPIKRLLDYQEEVKRYTALKNYEDLKKLSAYVIFDMTNERFEANKAYLQFVIAEEAVDLPLRVRDMLSGIYSNEDFVDELIRDDRTLRKYDAIFR
jgi:hypothetical protein